MSAVDYAQRSTKSYGKLVNQGLANIPDTDFAFVKVWDPGTSLRPASSGGQPKLQFFLFKGDTVIEIVVFPGDSVFMKQFDGILETIEII